MQNQESAESKNKVLIVGGGVGGIRAALDLAEAGRNVVLVDKAPAIGGIMTQLDRTFPTNNCDLCTLSPKLSQGGRENRIELATLSTVEEVTGEAGNFTVTLKTAPRYIDMERCTACGDCLEKYPEAVRFTPGLDHRAPTCMRYPQATPQAFSIDIEKAGDKEGLAKVCKASAIDFKEVETKREVAVGSIILAAGADLFDPSELDHFGGGAYPNVVTGLEYERIMSSSGPTGGNLVRPSDGRQPKKVAWIQCAGSRGINRGDAPYCSGVCCMYALKEAIVTKERFNEEMEATIFYMDMRTAGKDYELYRMRAEEEYGVNFIRSRPHTILQDADTTDLTLSYTLLESTELLTDIFDMVVLSTGFRVSPKMKALSQKLGIALNAYDFAQTSDFAPVATSRAGIYVCGLHEGPKDIPETMAQASAAACMAAGDLSATVELPETLSSAGAAETGEAAETTEPGGPYNADATIGAGEMPEPLPPERAIHDEEPRIGVFVCHCGDNIGSVIDVSAVSEYAAGLPGVVHSEVTGHSCSSDSIGRIQQAVKAHGLNRVVIGGCSPRTHEKKFQDVIRAAGLNRYLVEMANIRDQNTWVHKDNALDAIIKAQDQLRMAVSRVATRRPLTDHRLTVNRDILVLGGGVTGMNAAVSLADQGFTVTLVEQSPELGGVARELKKTLTGESVPLYLESLMEKTLAHPGIEILTGTTVVDHKGMPGRFVTGVQVAPRMYYRQIKHGVTIMATGALPHRPSAYLLGEHENVLTQIELGKTVAEDPDRVKSWENVVMIQCVGSRTKENPNCSKICCQSAIKNALAVLDANPAARVFILNRDIRTSGFQEEYYRKAREAGVIFVRYEPGAEPKVVADGKRISVTFRDGILERDVAVSADCLTLSTGLVADDENTEELARLFHLNRNADGYFLEDHVKLRPVDLSIPGFMVAGTAHGPKSIRESIAQAQAAAGRAQAFLAKNEINLGAGVAEVDPDKCATCLVCVRACPYGIPQVSEERRTSEIDPAKCHGCGECAAACPAKAIQLMQYEDDAISAELSGLLERIN